MSAYETRTAVAVLCSELAHEVSPTLAFLRDLARSRVLAPIDQSIAEEEVARLAGIVASLRRTKREEEPTKRVALASIAARAVRRIKSESPHADRIALDVADDVRVEASERAAELMVVALLRNALHASARAVTLRARWLGATWSLAVEDDGPGVAPDVADHLFTPLASLGPSGRGTGLAIVLRVARDHGWEIAHARENGRTILTVTGASPETQAAVSPP